ncbi:DNA translocase FtsK 4TM domain-containing protein [Candidatus Saccharibacteria bacterium]|nr:DNA translocase FtsK 4TM domain-containing protein [Candidatus Saccharibacteria bacterium]
MARRKTAKRGRKPAAKRVPAKKSAEMPSGFGWQVFGVFMILLAIVIVFMWFGSSGELLNSIHREAIRLVGSSVYLIPAALVYLAVSIFRAEGNRLPMRILISTILMLTWFTGLFGVFKNGGSMGAEMDKMVSGNLGSVAGFLIFAFLIFVTSIFVLQVSPMTVFKRIRGEKKEKDEDDIVIDAPVKKTELKISGETKPMAEKKPKKRFSLLKKDAIKKPVEKKEDIKAEKPVEKALVEVGDPNWKMPPLDLLRKVSSPADPGNVQQNAFIIKSTLADFGIDVEMDGANIGPRVTQYTLKPPAGVNLSKILARDKELALNLSVAKVRIEAPIPGTSLVGVEIPNAKPAAVGLRVLLESPEWKNADDPLTFAVGKDISGKSVVANLAKMPHLLIAGTTGSGKSVMTNAMIVSLLYRNSPSDLKFIIIDPKRVEMVQYADIPHLLTPIISETAEAVSSLKWAVNEMTRRYTLFAEEGVKNIVSYNKKKASDGGKVSKTDEDGNEQKHDGGKMPYIVIVIDEMSDIMMQAGKEMEPPIVRIAQMGRAAGIHLVLATQKPIVKVVTGLIKGNVPARIAFAVSSTTDSMVMLDKGGAEKLLGKGDMLMLTTDMQGVPRRIQGAMLEDEEEIKVANFLKEQRPPEYNKEVIAQAVSIGVGPAAGGSIGDMGRRFDPNDPVVRKAVEITLSKGKFATAMLQTYLGKGHGFVSGLAIWFEQIGVIGEANGNKPREVLIHSMEEFDELANS